MALDLFGDPVPEPPQPKPKRKRRERKEWDPDCVLSRDFISRRSAGPGLDMAAYDVLPPAVRAVVSESGAPLCAISVLHAVQDFGEDVVLTHLRAGVPMWSWLYATGQM